MSRISIIPANNEDTVAAEYRPSCGKAAAYQSEAKLEREFIELLTAQGYEYFTVRNENKLLKNVRVQLELLNDYTFSDDEWKRFYNGYLANRNDGILEKTRKVQDDCVFALKCDSGETRNIRIIDKAGIHNNRLQVINQYVEKGGARKTRYDVTILVNGLPLIHIELKRRGVAIREAFNQISRYERDSFGAGAGLFEYVQIYVITNGTNTKYYSNTTRERHIVESSNAAMRRRTKKTSNSFEFTSFWTDANNRIIADLVDFTKTFFAKHTILNILTKYCVFTADSDLLVMRPYQITATEQILNQIETAATYGKMGSVEAGGYVWHTTGSGKTLTSFKTAQLATKLSYIEKVLFVVDRKDLDYQTMREYDKFQQGAANSNTSTAVLKCQLEDTDTRIIITTIQKLDTFISKNKAHEIYKRHIVIIFDECHRSQFGSMHAAIVKAFKKYHIFGFTGTPIFAENAAGGGLNIKTTDQVFGKRLHTYNIVDAIRDANVLPFRIDYLKTKDGLAPARITKIVKYILEHFDQKTYRSQNYSHKVIHNVGQIAASKYNTVSESRQAKEISGFNSIFAVSSIPAAMLYYEEFRKQTKGTGKPLTVAVIYSHRKNEEDADEEFDNDGLDETSRDFLDRAIEDYNKMFAVNYDTSSGKFQNYYKDVSMRVKNREIDLLIVVDMFLTGFDATTLNTLWIDKNLSEHRLIQAFSRTNRILNSVKTFGNIVCFNDLQQAANDAIALYGDREAGGVVIVKTFSEYYFGYEENGKKEEGYKERIEALKSCFPLAQEITGEQAQKDFIGLFGKILKLKNILSAFDEFESREIFSERDFQDYQSRYLDLHQTYVKRVNTGKTDILDDLVFEIELIRQVEVNIDYILMLVAKYRANNCTNNDIRNGIDKAIGSSTELRSKRKLIEDFIEMVNVSPNIDDDWREFVKEQKERRLDEIIETENLNADETKQFMDNALRDGELKTTGMGIDNILPPGSLFDNSRQTKKKEVVAKLRTSFDEFLGLL